MKENLGGGLADLNLPAAFKDSTIYSDANLDFVEEDVRKKSWLAVLICWSPSTGQFTEGKA